MLKNLLIALVVALLLGVGALVLFFNNTETDQPAQTEVPAVVAIVNGEEISGSDFESLKAQIALEQGFDASEFDAETTAQFEEQVLDSLISQVLLRQAAAEAGIEADGAEVNAQMETIRGQFESEEAFEQALETEGLTEEELRQELAYDLTVQNYLEQTLNLQSIEATEEEIVQTYEEVSATGEVPPLEEVRSEVEQIVIQQKQQVLVEAHIQELRAEADIEILV